MEQESKSSGIIEVPITMLDENGDSYRVTAVINTITGEVNHVPLPESASEHP